MYAQGMTFGEYVAHYKLQRTEGLLLRYLTDAYRALRQSIPEGLRTGELEDLIAWLGEITRLVDSSLLDEWNELAALAGVGAGGRGVDATDDAEATIPAARDLAAQTGGVVAISGAQDIIVSTRRVTRLVSGHPMMQLVIGTGCSLGALVAAYLGAHRAVADGQDASFDLHDAVVAAHAHSGAAGMVAAQQASAPGSFAVAWIDALYQLTSERIAELVTIEEE